MSVFVDTGVFFAHHDTDAERHDHAVAAFDETFRRYHDQDLSFTDATIIRLCESRGIDSVLSFDEDFDGRVDRLEPGF